MACVCFPSVCLQYTYAASCFVNKNWWFQRQKAEKTKKRMSSSLLHCFNTKYPRVQAHSIENYAQYFFRILLLRVNIFSLSLFVHNYVNCFPIVNQNKPFRKSNKQNKALLPLALALRSNAKLKIHSKMEQSSKCVFVLLFRFHLDE